MSGTSLSSDLQNSQLYALYIRNSEGSRREKSENMKVTENPDNDEYDRNQDS